MRRQYRFSWRRFLSAFVNVAAALIFLVGAISGYAYYQSGHSISFFDFLALPYTALAMAYFAFFTSWVIAYSHNTDFPNSQYVLLIGVVIGALVIAIITMADGNYKNVTWPTDLLAFATRFGVSLIASALQIYALVLLLRYIDPDDGW